MAIYPPEFFLTGSDRELLRLLGELVLSWDGVGTSNAGLGSVTLTQSEARRLLELLEQFVSSRQFTEGTYLAEKLFGDGSLYDRTLRDIFLAGRKRVGKSRAVATIQWENLLGRIGIWTPDRDNPNVWYRASARPMPLDHFMRMEAKLATAVGLHPRIKALILKLVEARLDYIEQVRFGERKLDSGQISGPPKQLLSTLQREGTDAVGPPPMNTSKLVGIMTIVMDLSALYTTRDWSVASFLSTIAGATPPVVLD